MILKILIYFLCKNCTPPLWKKSLPLFPIKPPLKAEVLSSPPFLKIWFAFAERGGCTLCIWRKISDEMGIWVKKKTPCFDPVNYCFLDLAFWKIKEFTKLLFKRWENVFLFSEFLQGYSECKLLTFWKTKLCENFYKLFNVYWTVYCNHLFTSVRIT